MISEDLRTHTVVQVRQNDYNYEPGTFLAINYSNGGTEVLTLWVAKSNELVSKESGRIYSLTVRWYEPSNSKDVINCRYLPAFMNSPKHGSRVEWKDIVTSETVLVNFADLIKTGHLASETLKILLSSTSKQN